MNILLNSKPYEVEQNCTLTQLLEALDQSPLGIAFAVDSVIIKRTEWDNFQLKEGHRVTMIKAACGG